MGKVRAAWQRVRSVDPRIADGALVVVLTVVAASELLFGYVGGAFVGQDTGLGQAVHLPAVLGTIVPLLWRRRWPIGCWCAQFLMALLTLRPPVAATLVAQFLGIYSIGVYSPRRLLSLAPPLGSALVLAILFPTTTASLPPWALELLVGMGMWLAGNAMRDRDVRAQAVEERALRLEHEHELATRVAAADERARIARELHDVVAHSVSVMVVQAGAARRLLTQRPERAGEALREVEASGRDALTELRRLLGLLADEPDGGGLAPQPGLSDLDALVERVRSAGLPVTVRREGSPRPLPAGLDLTAYRIVQEALTNALRHAGGARTEVVVGYGERTLTLEVVDAGGSEVTAPGAGRGLMGMKERTAVYGGELEAAPLPGGGFAVRARLPIDLQRESDFAGTPREPA